MESDGVDMFVMIDCVKSKTILFVCRMRELRHRVYVFHANRISQNPKVKSVALTSVLMVVGLDSRWNEIASMKKTRFLWSTMIILMS